LYTFVHFCLPLTIAWPGFR